MYYGNLPANDSVRTQQDATKLKKYLLNETTTADALLGTKFD